MKNRKKKKSKILLWIGFILLIYCIFNVPYVQRQIERIKMGYEEPINLETGLINNKYFGIYSNGKNPKQTTDGINEAIKYAQKNNIKDIKLELGEYQVIGDNNSHYRGITLQSNINLDLNGSKIIQRPNDYNTYANITMYEIENASISNGIIIGDTEKHIYNPKNGKTHEDGYGISIIACKNVKVKNLEIYNMTGDGINLYGINKGEKIDDNVTIENCNIYNCRRQGITVGCGKNILIQNNEIHDIKGTAPQTAIDIEGNFKTEITDNVVIKNNKMYNLENVNALLLVGFIENVEISSNEIEQNVLVYDAKEKIIFKNNVLKNSLVKFSNDYTNMRAGHNIKNLEFVENYLEDSSLELSKVENANILNNEIINGNLRNISSNCIITNNRLKNMKNSIDVAIELSNISGHTEKYTAKVNENVIEGEYVQKIQIDTEFYTIK